MKLFDIVAGSDSLGEMLFFFKSAAIVAVSAVAMIGGYPTSFGLKISSVASKADNTASLYDAKFCKLKRSNWPGRYCENRCDMSRFSPLLPPIDVLIGFALNSGGFMGPDGPFCDCFLLESKLVAIAVVSVVVVLVAVVLVEVVMVLKVEDVLLSPLIVNGR